MEDSRIFDGMTPEKQAEVERVYEVMSKAMNQELWQLAKFMVTRRDDQLFGETEFVARDRVLRAGAKALEATVNDRKKRGIKAAARSAPTVAKTPAFRHGGREPS